MIKFYCPTHGDLGCGDCVVLDHRNCKVDYIANVAKDFVIGNELRQLEQSIKQAEVILSGSIRNVGELLNEVENQAKDEIDRLRKFRAEINTYPDRREKELLDNLQKVKTEDEIVLTDLKTDCELAKSRLEAMKIILSYTVRGIKKTQKELGEIKYEMNKITDLIKARKYRFVEDPDTERLLGSDMGLGGLDVTGELVVFTFLFIIHAPMANR
ncbi:hypothetical protein MAR_027108 [Mya arenaria]|uniref:Uncharacterized protein n=1 Tax=Mya arenaria TaxID=6604 RepID=A0ABY7ESJ2_MYAAR|nr:hypothetical protein MAR_027108 [Mya arenaria]